MRIKAFRQAFLVHGQRVYFQFIDPVLDHGQKLFIYPALHVAEGDIGVRTLSGAGNLHGKLRIADTAADQGRVENKSFHKPVTGTAKHLVLFRFRYAAGRIGAAVDGEAAVISIDKQA
ncbi:uncharacterized protein BN544_03684 [Hungatella hathewayi CAG:224]|nr:uncharacterized protein BN544_03684 [Hungatella hathewayi CAG:224]